MSNNKKAGDTPRFVTPMGAVAVKQLPEGADWLYEVKFDGYRVLIIKDGTRVRLQSRNEKALTSMYPELLRPP